jgi:multiple sugar transport system permease protein
MVETAKKSGRPWSRFWFRTDGDWTEKQLAFLLNIPTSLIILLFIAYPLFYVFVISLQSVTISGLRSGNTPFVGLENYITIFSDPLFLTTLGRTLVMSAVSVTLMISIGLFVAMAMNQKVKISGLTRALVLLPWAVPPIANGIMWGFVYNSRYGHLNAVLYSLGIVDEFVSIVGDPFLAKAGVIWAYVWRVIPFSALLFYAALQGIPEELYEAAEVDGANGWQQFWKITLPMLRPVIAVLLILRTAFAMTIFDEVFAITQGGPGDSTWTSAWYSYWSSFRLLKFDIGAASSFVLAIIIAIFAFIYIRLIYRPAD